MTDSDTIATLRARLTVLSPAAVDIRDDSARHADHSGNATGAGHFSLTVVADCFKEQSRLARHRQVLDTLRDLIPGIVHAVTLRTLTPEEVFFHHPKETFHD